MTADKRSVHTDALATLGTIIDETAARDAIHLAVEPVVAGRLLIPGQDVCLIDGRAYPTGAKMVGIVDPFLRNCVHEGERFWLVVYPRQITSLRHVWSHPDFPEGDDSAPGHSVSESEKWIRDFAESVGLGYQRIMDGAADWIAHQDYILGGEELEGEYVPGEFWTHYQIVTGKQVDESHQRSFFTCAC